MKKLYLVLFLISNLTFAQVYFPKNDGVKQSYNSIVAITNATIFVSATQKIEKATLLIQENKIVDVGLAITIPKEATIIDAKGKYIYPSFIDLFSDFGITKGTALKPENTAPQYDSKREGYYWNDHIKADYNASENLSYETKAAASLREIGFGTVLSHNNDGVIAGTGILWTLNDQSNNATRIIDQKASQHFTFKKSNQSKQSYPSSLMGSMALLRQFFHDAKWYATGSSKTKDLSIEAYNSNKSLLQVFNAGDKLSGLRADKIANEFGLNFIIKGKGNEFESIDAIKKTGATYIIPINFPEPYDVSNKYIADQISLSDMKFWNQAPNNPQILAQNNVPFVFTTSDLKEQKSFLTNLRKAVLYGLSKEKALQALTETPAKLLNKDNLIGSLSKGKMANFIIVSGDLFDAKSTIQENWVQGNQNIVEKTNENDIRGTYDLSFDNQKYDLVIEGETNKLEAKTTKDALKFKTKIEFNEPWLYLVVKDQDSLKPSFSRLSTIFANGKFTQGKAILKDGKEANVIITKKEALIADKKEYKKEDKPLPMYPITFPNVSFGKDTLPQQETFLFKNATVWTGEKEGNLLQTDVLVEKGKISKIGKNLSAINAKTIDANGKHITAGIIDEHSHIAISNGVNEGGQNSSAEVTIEDVVNSEDINIYRNLAGGVTTSNLLHGSANPIGGRAALVKLKWGYSPDEMLVKNNPKYIKFALGENVKQSNWGEMSRNRFPQSRMGVEQVYEDYFTRAIAYKKEWNDYNSVKAKTKTMPRFDIEMEVLSDVLNKKCFVTCHSYVQSEINMLIKLADRYNFKIQTFTHILEGYKVADKMKTHGVSGSTFSDWWSYKFEVNDAIPYNAALMHNQGVCVSINSDDAEMSRRLNQEAAKTVKYGEITEEQAWNFVTLNPAKILQIDDKVGSIKVGKDADLVLWTDNPLSIYAKVEKTVVDGILFYDLEKQNEIKTNINKEKADLINAMINAKNEGQKTQVPMKKGAGHYHCDTLDEFCTDTHYKNN
jgi:imidazolonepropionase-like amidohydrolase